MANEKILNTRIQLKYDTLANWNASPVILKPGELAIVQVPTVEASTLQPVMFKVGDGNHRFNELDWASAKAADVYAWAKKSGIDVIDNGTGNVVSDIEWIDDALVITRIDVYTKSEADERFQPVGNYKTKQAEVANKITDKAHVLTALAQNANGEISYDVKELTPEDIGAQPAGNYKTKQEQYSNSGSTAKTITNVSQNANGEVTVTYEDIAFPVVDLPTVAAGEGIDVAVNDLTYTVSHKDTSDVANVAAADRTYVKSLTFDDFGHVTGVTTGTETVVDTNTEYHIEYDSVAKEIKLVTGADASKMTIDATDFIKDGMIESVKLEENTLVITWNTDAGSSKTEIELDHLIDVYTGKKGTTVEVAVSGNEIGAEVIAGSLKDSHIAADAAITKTKFAEAVQVSLGLADTAVQPEDLGSMAKEDKNDYKTKQTAVQDPSANGASQTNEFIASISQNENGEITATKKSVNLSEYAKKIDLTNAIGDGVLTLAGNEGLEGNATFSANQKDASSFTVGIKAKGVTTNKIDDLAVTDTKLAVDSVTTAKIVNKNVTKEKLADDVQTSLGLADNAVQSVDTGLGLKNTGTEKNVVVDFDPDVVFVFNCGSATELID